MKRNIRFNAMIMISITLILLGGCSSESNRATDTKGDSAQTVVENYFKYENEKNKDKLLTTLTEHFNAPNVVWGFDNLESTKIINIEEEMDEKVKEGYLHNGRGSINGTTENNLKVYKVKYKVKYKNDEASPQNSGIYDWWYFVIRKDENSPWLIDDMGV
ncbi:MULTISPECIES: DUF4829 domain-containing protein [unclassified Clostridium]|uniref:DUF4829 domain-containing protein n=1 Tax=unclassified Clostridium TaxID=2614128 RepID=UPI0012434164